MGRSRRGAARLLAGVAITSFIAGSLIAFMASRPDGDAHAAPPGDSQVVAYVARGVGNGHGRGLSQWGAYGRAVNGGQSWQQILDAYYGGTHSGARGKSDFRVRLTRWDNAPAGRRMPNGL